MLSLENKIILLSLVLFPSPRLTCITKVSLVGVTIVIPWVSVHLRPVGGRQVRLLGVQAVRGVGLRHH